MKELSIEEKAKRYDKAIERARCYKGLEAEMSNVFPELKESEDERIRKALIRYFTLSDEQAYNEACGVYYRDIVAWLEKQGKKELSWSEEDEGYMDRILEALYDYYPKRYAQSIYDWLESLKKV